MKGKVLGIHVETVIGIFVETVIGIHVGTVISTYIGSYIGSCIVSYIPILYLYSSRLCRLLEECITVRDNGTLLYRPYQPMIQN